MENENQNVENTNTVSTQPIVTEETNDNVEQSVAPVAPVEPVAPVTPIVPVQQVPVQPIEPATPIQPMTQSVPSEVPKKKNTILPVLIIIGVLLVALIVGAIFLLPSLMFTGEKAIDNEITEIFSKTKKSLKDSEKYVLSYDLDNESLGFEGSLTVDSDYKNEVYDLSKLKEYKLNYSGAIDKKSNGASASFILSKNSTDLLTLDGYITGKDVYLSMKDVFNKIIHTETDQEIKDLELSKSTSMEDIIKLLDKTELAFKNSIKKENIKEEKVDGYKKVTYTYKTTELEKSILTSFVNDQETIDILKKITNLKEDEIKKRINDELSKLETSTNSEETVIVLYLQGFRNEFKKTEISTGTSKIIIDKENSTYKYEVYNNTTKELSGEYDEANKIFTLNSDVLTAKIQSKDGTITIDAKYDDSNQIITLNATIVNKLESNKQINTTTANIKYSSGDDEINATISNEIVLDKNKKIDELTDKSNTIDLDDLSDSDYETIENNISKVSEQILKDIMPNGYPSYDYYDYYSDYSY